MGAAVRVGVAGPGVGTSLVVGFAGVAPVGAGPGESVADSSVGVVGGVGVSVGLFGLIVVVGLRGMTSVRGTHV